MIVDLLPAAAAVLREIKKTDDRRSQFRVIEQVEIAMERGGTEVENLPHKRELKIEIYPPAGDQREFQPAGDRGPVLRSAMRQHRQRHHDGNNMQYQQRVPRLGCRHSRVEDYFVVNPIPI